jgi:hypothetical protein
MKKKTGIAVMHIDALGGNEGLANRFSAVPHSEQITPSPGQLGVGETKTSYPRTPFACLIVTPIAAMTSPQ